MAQWRLPAGSRSQRGWWKQASVACLTLLPAAFLLQFVLLHSRHGLAGDLGSGGGNDEDIAAAQSSTGDDVGLSVDSAIAGRDASRYCKPVAELGAVTAAAAINSTVLLTASLHPVILKLITYNTIPQTCSHSCR